MTDTAIGTTVAFGTSSFTANVRELSLPEESRNDIPTTTLATTGHRTYIPGKLTDTDELTMVVLFDPDDIPPQKSAPETLTITTPIPSGGITGATLIGTGYVKAWQPSTFTDTEEEAMQATLTWKWDGLTNPAWSAST